MRIEREFAEFPIKALEDTGARAVFLDWRDELAKTSLRQADHAYTTLARVLSWFGWRRDKEGGLVPEASEQSAIARMRALRGEGLSLRAIRDRLAAEGMKVSHVAVGNALKTAAPLDAQVIDRLRAAARAAR